jgi:hypothetical protein
MAVVPYELLQFEYDKGSYSLMLKRINHTQKSSYNASYSVMLTFFRSDTYFRSIFIELLHQRKSWVE